MQPKRSYYLLRKPLDSQRVYVFDDNVGLAFSPSKGLVWPGYWRKEMSHLGAKRITAAKAKQLLGKKFPYLFKRKRLK